MGDKANLILGVISIMGGFSVLYAIFKGKR